MRSRGSTGRRRVGFATVAGAWVEAFMGWLEVFPFGGHDDPVDVISILWDMLYTAEDSETTEQADVAPVELDGWDGYSSGGGLGELVGLGTNVPNLGSRLKAMLTLT